MEALSSKIRVLWTDSNYSRDRSHVGHYGFRMLKQTVSHLQAHAHTWAHMPFWTGFHKELLTDASPDF